MKKILFSIIAVACISAITFAQIPNFSFENWTAVGSYSVPDNWGTMNNATASFSVATVTKATPGNPGNFYIKLTSLTTGTTVTNGVAVSGKLDTITMQAKSGFSFTQRPANLTGKWQHMIYGSSQGSILVTLTRWDTGLNMRIPVASGNVTLSGMAMSWTNFSIPINYVDGNNPDTCIIVMKASGNNPTNNDYLWVDGLAFSGSVTGIQNQNSFLNGLTVFPNPSSEKITVSISIKTQQAVSLNVFDINGKLIRTKELGVIQGESKQIMDLTGVAKGNYILKIIGEAGTETRKIVVE